MKCPNCRLENPDTAQRCDCGYDFESQSLQTPHPGAQAQPQVAGAEARTPSGIGGWLLVPAVVLPIVCVQALLECFRVAQTGSRFDAAFMAAVSLGLLLTVAAFFLRSRWAPRLIIAWLLLLVGALLLLLLGDGLEGLARRRVRFMLTEAGIVALVWVPYFLVSKRVEATFGRSAQARTRES